jgi:hypothetical protein
MGSVFVTLSHFYDDVLGVGLAPVTLGIVNCKKIVTGLKEDFSTIQKIIP